MTDYDLHDVVSDDVPMGQSATYMGFHVIATGNGSYIVQYDGHVGEVDQFAADEYDDVLALVDDLNSHVVRLHEYDYQDDRDGLIEWAGPVMTHDREQAENDDHYQYVPRPDDIEGAPAGDD